MSYILDALRKSAEERRKLQEQKPELHDPLSIRQEPGDSKGKSRFSFLSVCLLLIAAVTGIWLYYAPIGLEQSNGEQAAAKRRQEPSEKVEEQGGVQQQKPVSPAASEPSIITAQPVPEVPETPRSIETAAQPASPPPAPKANAVKPAPSPAAIPLLKELPFATQAAIPEMKFSGHVFSPDPSLRMIMVNTSIVREGDMITPDVKLIEITENGLVLSFQQKPFRIELF